MFFRKIQISKATLETREMKMHQRRIRESIRRFQEEFPRVGDRTKQQGQVDPAIHIIAINDTELFRNRFKLSGISRCAVYFHQ